MEQSSTTFLDSWKTSAGMFILGFICSYGLGSLGAFGTPIFLVAGIVFALGTTYWVFAGYPSLFTVNPCVRSSSAASFLNGFFGGIIFGALWNTCLTKKQKGVSQYVLFVLLIAMSVGVGALFLMGQSSSQSPNAINSTSPKSSAVQQTNNASNKAESKSSAPAQTQTPTTRTYEDKRWPTFNSDTLAIPDWERWYNAGESLGTYCKITGPVSRVYEGRDTDGNQVTFIEMGVSGSSSKPVLLAIWPWDVGGLQEVIDGCRKKSSWLSVEGYLQDNNGNYIFASGDGVTCTFWVNTQWG